jgi:hypothetical protein
VILPVDHIIGGIHVILVHKVATPGRSDVMRRIYIQPAILPHMGGGIGRIDIGDKRVLRPAPKRKGQQQIDEEGGWF